METDKQELLENLTDEELEKEMDRRNETKRAEDEAKYLAKQRARHKAKLISEGIINENDSKEDLIEALHNMYVSDKLNDHNYNNAMNELFELHNILNLIPKRIVLKAKRKLVKLI